MRGAAALGPELPEVRSARGSLAGDSFPSGADTDAVVVAVAPAREAADGVEPRSGTVDAAARYAVDLAELADRTGGPGFTGAAGDIAGVDLPRAHEGEADLPWADLPARIVLVGIGGGTPAELRKAGAAVAGATRGLGRVVSVAAAEAGADGARAFVEGYLLAGYRPTPVDAADLSAARGGADVPSAAPPAASGADRPARVLVMLGPDVEAAIAAAERAARATCLVRDLANTPANIKTPNWLAERVQALGAGAGVAVRVLDPADLAAAGLGAILAVGAGSASSPRLVIADYVPSGRVARRARHIVLVGKGITFDTGGLDIKPRTSMVTMKTDMAGAAVALATVLGAAEAALAHRVTAVLALAENHFGGASYRPSDVLRTGSGRTVEVGDTDAEGRLVLADALGYAVAEWHPDVLIDVATLTGSATVGLGRTHAALFASDDALAERLIEAGEACGERLWRLPLVPEYRSALRSDVADLRNVPHESPGGGAITAALFLQEFAGAGAWAHLDIAGTARHVSGGPGTGAGATGFGARVLLRYLEALGS